MKLEEQIVQDLGIHRFYVKTTGPSSAKCLLHQRWLFQMLTDMRIPKEFAFNDTLTDTECQLLLNQKPPSEAGPWVIVALYIIPKHSGKVQRLPKAQSSISTQQEDLNYFQLLHYVSETNYRNLWKHTWKKYHSSEHSQKDQSEQTYNEVVEEIINRLYQCPIIRDHEPVKPAVKEPAADNLMPVMCTVETVSCFYLFCHCHKHSLHDCVTFSPAIIDTSTTRSLYIIYQLLQVLRMVHNKGLYLGNLTLHDISLDQKLWVQVIPKIWDDVLTEANVYCQEDKDVANCGSDNIVKSCIESPQYGTMERMNLTEGKTSNLHALVSFWVKGQISNFDYLMELNKLAGREMNNPNYHPVLPWIMDLTLAEGHWRDLSKSKYRLNKGDRQLDLVYESAVSGSNAAPVSGPYVPLDTAIQVPHHVSEVLSDITYYVYKARRLPTSLLCHHVRRKWVPAEYPASIQRLQEWTPDECIPEFYSDPSIFYSIHFDLPDLEVPCWADSPEDFIAKHRAALESDYISERLHHWIDLTFGYKLSGSAAIKSKNVCLPLVDQHTTLNSNGVVQLFTSPHPHKMIPSIYDGKIAPKIFKPVNSKQSELKDSGDEELSEAKTSKRKYFKSKANVESFLSESRPELQTIVPPKDYNPLASLNQLESLFAFTAQTSCIVPSFESQIKQHRHMWIAQHHYKSRDMLVFGCLIAEIALAPRLRVISRDISLTQRYNILLRLLKLHSHEVSRCFQQALQLLLQIDFFNKQIPGGNVPLPLHYSPVTSKGLPLPCAHQLLQPLICILPFPPYFPELHAFIKKMNQYSILIEEAQKIQMTEEKQNKINCLASTKVNIVIQTLPSLLTKLNSEGLNLLTPYIQDLFEQPSTSLLAAWHLFNQVSQALGPQQTTRKLLVSLTRLFDPEVPSPKHLKLYHRSYLLQLIVRLGLQTFLSHFMTLIIEATGGFHDFTSQDSLRCQGEPTTRKSSQFHLPEFEQLGHDAENDFGTCPPETALSPYDDDSSQTDPSSNRSGKNNGNGVEGEPEIFVLEAAGDEDDDDDDDMEAVKLNEMKDEDQLAADVIDRGLSFLEVQTEERWAEDSSEERRVADEHFDGPELEIDLPDETDSEHCLDISAPDEGINTALPSLYSSSVPNLPSQLRQWSLISEKKQKKKMETVEDIENISQNQKPLSPNTKAKNKMGLEINISDVAAESIIWLAHRLGPVLTAKYITRNLLRMLSLCYNGCDQLVLTHPPPDGNDGNTISISKCWITGDDNSARVLQTLSSIAALYGEQFILLQYLPHVSELLSNCKRRINENLESGIVGGIALVKHVIPYLSDATLMDNLQDLLIKNILLPIIRIISSLRQTFPNSSNSRCIIAWKLIDTIYLISLRIGFEMTRKLLSTLLERFFSCFDKAYENHPYAGKKSTRFEGVETEDPGATPHSIDDYLEIKKNSETNEYVIGTPVKLSCVLLHNNASLDSLSPPMSDQKGNAIRELALEEIRGVFTPELAYTAYIHFCKLAGGIHMEQTLKNEELIRHLCALHDDDLERCSRSLQQEDSTGNFEGEITKSHHRMPSLGQDDTIVSGVFGKNVAVVGNRIDIQLSEDNISSSGRESFSTSHQLENSKLLDIPKYDMDLLRRKMDNTQRHLKGNWLLYWEHETGRSDKDYHFNFKQIKLQSFVGHNGSIRTIHALDNENSFLTGSKDKTVKLWSLRSCGNGSTMTPCQWTYTQHRKSVFAVAFLDSLRLVGSCDSTVHVWDPFMGSCIHQLDSPKGSIVTVLTAMSAPSTSFVAATTSSTVRFLDARTCRYMHEYKVSIGPAGLIRCLAGSPNGNWLAVGHSSGMISVLDVRNGLLFESWMGHEGEILNLKAFNNSCFVSSSLDHSVSVWSAEDAKLKCYLRGPLEPVTCLAFHCGEVITGTTANKIGVHSTIESQCTFTSTRLRSDTFKGILTSMALLPLNRLLLLGADNGGISLLC